MLVKCSVAKIELTVDVFTNTICCVDCKPFLEINVLSICFIFMQRRMTSLLPRRGHPYPSPSQQRIPCEASRPPRWGKSRPTVAYHPQRGPPGHVYQGGGGSRTTPEAQMS